jgi:hypothetical protein
MRRCLYYDSLSWQSLQLDYRLQQQHWWQQVQLLLAGLQDPMLPRQGLAAQLPAV